MGSLLGSIVGSSSNSSIVGTMVLGTVVSFLVGALVNRKGAGSMDILIGTFEGTIEIVESKMEGLII